MLNEVIVTEKTNQLLAKLRGNPDWVIEKENFKALEWVLQDTGIIER